MDLVDSAPSKQSTKKLIKESVSPILSIPVKSQNCMCIAGSLKEDLNGGVALTFDG